MGLTFTKSAPEASIFFTSWLIYGPKKIGKSTLASHFRFNQKEPLFIATEDGHQILDVFSHRVNSWKEFKDYVKELKKNKKQIQEQFSVIVVDLVSDLDDMCKRHVAATLGLEMLGDGGNGFGKDFAKYQTEFKSVMADLWSIAPLVFICHEKTVEIKDASGNTYHKIQINIPHEKPNHTGYFIEAKVQNKAYIMAPTQMGGNSVLTMVPNPVANAGTRYLACAKQYELDAHNMAASVQAIHNDYVSMYAA